MIRVAIGLALLLVACDQQPTGCASRVATQRPVLLVDLTIDSIAGGEGGSGGVSGTWKLRTGPSGKIEKVSVDSVDHEFTSGRLLVVVFEDGSNTVVGHADLAVGRRFKEHVAKYPGMLG